MHKDYDPLDYIIANFIGSAIERCSTKTCTAKGCSAKGVFCNEVFLQW